MGCINPRFLQSQDICSAGCHSSVLLLVVSCSRQFQCLLTKQPAKECTIVTLGVPHGQRYLWEKNSRLDYINRPKPDISKEASFAFQVADTVRTWQCRNFGDRKRSARTPNVEIPCLRIWFQEIVNPPKRKGCKQCDVAWPNPWWAWTSILWLVTYTRPRALRLLNQSTRDIWCQFLSNAWTSKTLFFPCIYSVNKQLCCRRLVIYCFLWMRYRSVNEFKTRGIQNPGKSHVHGIPFYSWRWRHGLHSYCSLGKESQTQPENQYLRKSFSVAISF